MEEYLDRIKFILKNLGIINLEIVEIFDQYNIDKNKIFYLNLTRNRRDENGNILTAQMVVMNDCYRLLKGSYIEKEVRESFKHHVYYPLRKKYETDEYMQNSQYEGCFILKKDIDFSSPSAAAAVVKNRATNGPKEWKLKDGTVLDEYLSNMNND